TPVVVTLGGLRRQRDADPEGIDRGLEVLEAIVAQTLGEVQPEVLWPEVQAQPELFGREIQLVRAQVGPPQVIMLPGGARLCRVGVRRLVAAARSDSGAQLSVERGARSEQRLRLLEGGDGLPPGFRDLRSRRVAHAEVGPDENEIQQID